jgi:hypothetical protein
VYGALKSAGQLEAAALSDPEAAMAAGTSSTRISQPVFSPAQIKGDAQQHWQSGAVAGRFKTRINHQAPLSPKPRCLLGEGRRGGSQLVIIGRSTTSTPSGDAADALAGKTRHIEAYSGGQFGINR